VCKYEPLWKFVQSEGPSRGETFKLTYDEIAQVLGFPIDHSFLTYKKELPEYGFKVGKISMKEKTVVFEKV